MEPCRFIVLDTPMVERKGNQKVAIMLKLGKR